jgi:hypothetical protein
MFATRGRGSIRAPLQTLYPSPFSSSRKRTNEVQAESTPSTVTTLAPTTTTNPISKKEIEALRKKESRRLQKHYHKEVKESLAENRELQIHIPTDETCNIIGLKAKWQNIVKDITYWILDLRIRHGDRHP